MLAMSSCSRSAAEFFWPSVQKHASSMGCDQAFSNSRHLKFSRPQACSPTHFHHEFVAVAVGVHLQCFGELPRGAWRENQSEAPRLCCCWIVHHTICRSIHLSCAGFVRPDGPDKVIATGSEPLDQYQRKTQSPLIWS